jgi:hypothetical protein
MTASVHRAKQSGRTRVIIVDPGWHVGLRLADCLATGGYHAVLVRDLESTLLELAEIQPAAILLGARFRGGALCRLGAIREVCPQTSVFNFVEPLGEGPLRPSGLAEAPAPPSHPHGSHPVVDWLHANLGIPCARVQ